MRLWGSYLTSLLFPHLQNGETYCAYYTGSFCCCSVTQLCPTLCDPMDCSMPGFPVLHCLPELAQTHVHWVGDATQPSHPLFPPSSPAFSLSQHQGLFPWVGSTNCGQSIGASASASVLPMNIQGWLIDWLDLLAVQGTLNSLLQHQSLKVLILLYGSALTSIYDYWKNHSFDSGCLDDG